MAVRDIKLRRKDSSAPSRYRKGRQKYMPALTTFQDEMNRFFESFWEEPRNLLGDIENMYPVLDIIENEKSYTLKAELPGMDPDDVEISITDSFITISGEKQEEKEEEDQSYLRNEVTYGAFERTIALPSTANAEDAEAEFNNGVLTVSVPKKADALQKPKKLQIRKAA